MKNSTKIAYCLLIIFCITGHVQADSDHKHSTSKSLKKHHYNERHHLKSRNIDHKELAQIGPRPFYLIEKMSDSELKNTLQQCDKGPFFKTDFSIGHRGAPLQFPEHTKESYMAAAKMGAGIIECDVTFTKDHQLVCRHSQCDLQSTTNIVATELGSKCSQPFSPADLENGAPATATCCTSDITLEEYKSLCGKMDAVNPNAQTPEEYLDGTASFRTDLYSSCGTLLSHKESITLFSDLGVKFTPELKSASVDMPHQGNYSQQVYAQQMINDYKDAGIEASKVFAQSFNLDDIRYWIETNPEFGKQAVYLDARPYEDISFLPTLAGFETLKSQGINIVAPPMAALLTTDTNGNIVPSDYATYAKAAGLEIITWSLERSGRINEDMKRGAGGTFYYATTLDALKNDGDIMKTLDILAKDVGIMGIFSDWPGTVTYYANCMGL